MTNFPYNEKVIQSLPWTSEQVLAYKRWRDQYASCEQVIYETCPAYMKHASTFPERLVACYCNTLIKGERAGNPVDAVDGKILKMQIQKEMDKQKVMTEGQIK